MNRQSSGHRGNCLVGFTGISQQSPEGFFGGRVLGNPYPGRFYQTGSQFDLPLLHQSTFHTFLSALTDSRTEPQVSGDLGGSVKSARLKDLCSKQFGSNGADTRMTFEDFNLAGMTFLTKQGFELFVHTLQL